MDMHAVKSAATYVAMLTFLLAAKGTTAQLCYNTTAGCQSSFFRFTGSASPALQCCVSFIGYAYTSSTSNDGCSFCTVYGFVSGMMSTGVQLNSITIKQGDPGVPVSYTLLRGRLSSIRSFTITSSNPRLYTPTTTDSHIQFFAPFAIRYTLKVELSNVALETPKTFILSSTLSSSSGNEFTAPLTVTVLPVNILNIQFTDTVYTVVEGTNKSARLLLRRTQFIEQPLQLRVTPLTLAEAGDRNITLPADAWKDTSIYPASYAGERKQFVNTPQIISFTTTGSNETVPIQIAILDDGLNGPDVQFVCIVELVNQSFASIVNISSPVALVRIIESDLVTCFTSSTTCTSTSVTITGTQSAGQCCLNRGGRSYKTGTSGVCTPCAVYGFFQSPTSTQPLTSISQREGSQLIAYFGFVNGTFSGSHSVSFSVLNSPRYIKSFTTGVLTTGAARQQFTLQINLDNIALQPPLSVSVSAMVDGSSEFVLPFNAVLLDADVVNIGFRESEYSVTEGEPPPDQYARIKLVKDKTIAQPLSVQVVPLTVGQFKPLGIPLPDGISFADLSSPAQSISNGTKDFDNSILNLTFNFSQSALSPNVGIVDDQINEAEQQFICIVRLANPSVNASGNVIIKNPSTVIWIVDNDPIAIGFGNGTYTFTKGGQSYYEDTVRLVKDDGVVSEQTFNITIIAQSNAVDYEATYDTDYHIGPMPVQNFTMTPDQQYIPIIVNIYDAGLTGTLQAQLSSTQVPNTPTYIAPHNPTTLLVILDNKVAIVGFTDGRKVVTEGEDFSECVAVTDPPPESTMKLSFFIKVLLIPDTADASDVSVGSTILGPFNDTNRMYCFNTTALADEYFEGSQTFYYSLTLIGELIPVMISSNVTMLTIIDNTMDQRAIYLIPTKAAFVVRENQNQAVVCFVAAPVAAIPVNVTVVAMEDDVPSARSPQDFIASSVRLTIPPHTSPQSELCVAFTIIDNKVALERNKTFSIKVLPSPKVILLKPISHVLIVDDDAVYVNFTSSNYTSVGSGYTSVCVSKDVATTSNINVEMTLTSSNVSCTYGDFSPTVYSTVLVAGPAGVPACVTVTTFLWEGRSLFRMSITKVTTAGGIVKVGTPSSASVNAGCLENEDISLCHYVSGTSLCQLKIYNQLCCRTCGVMC